MAARMQKWVSLKHGIYCMMIISGIPESMGNAFIFAVTLNLIKFRSKGHSIMTTFNRLLLNIETRQAFFFLFQLQNADFGRGLVAES